MAKDEEVVAKEEVAKEEEVVAKEEVGKEEEEATAAWVVAKAAGAAASQGDRTALNSWDRPRAHARQ